MANPDPCFPKLLFIDKKKFEDWMLILGRNAQYAIQKCFRNPSPSRFESALREWDRWSFMLYYLFQWAGDAETYQLLKEYYDRWKQLIYGLETVLGQMVIVHDPNKPRCQYENTLYQLTEVNQA